MPTSITPPPKDDEFECAQCGAYFHYELTRCPECGASVYGEEEPGNRPSSPGLFARAGSALRRLFGKEDAAEALFAGALQQAELYQELLRKVNGDPAAAERLIEYEKQRLPEAARAAWLRNAIQHWERDNQ